MELRLAVKSVAFALLVVIGIPGNIFIVLKFFHIRIVEKKLLPTNTILMSLSLFNVFVLLCRVLPHALNYTGLEDFLNDIQCQILMYVYRVSRAMTICVTSLLSCHQCILIAPVNKKWKFLKHMVNPNVSIILAMLLGMNMSLYPSSLLYTRTRSNATRSPYTLRLGYCDVDFLNYISYIINGLVSAIREIIFVGLMTLSSIYIVYVLHNHGKAMKGMRSSDKVQSRTVEHKASRAVIMLVVMYALLFGMDNCMWVYTLTMSNVSPDVSDTRLFLAASYAAMSPYLIFATNPKVNHVFIALFKRKRMEIIKGIS
ncbi:olfactory receptor class A-like protein 1 [Dendropsophus ebraccatus]|uniref:olfactory receptor class A-like protein 1 n=1 Tax=Dendropsophus ebraccatus TaxID=150705 RepID=UPI003831FCDA